MLEKERLFADLFQSSDRKHVNIKFFRGSADDISVEQFCGAVNHALFQVASGLVAWSSTFAEDLKQVDVKGLPAS
jgi:hypothetical protein